VIRRCERAFAVKDNWAGCTFESWTAEQEGSAHPIDREVQMTKSDSSFIARATILSLADIKAAIDSFERGESNAFDTLDAICMAVESHQTAMGADSQRKQPRQNAA
jgi:hypothetical protein